MAEVFVINSLNNTKSVKFNIGLRYFIVKGDQDGDHKWVLEIGTTHEGANGEDHLVKRIHNIDAEDLDEVMENAISELCGKIDWAPFVEDKEAPNVVEASPKGDNVPIGSIVSMKVVDELPSSGIDLSDISVTLNNGEVDFDITNEIKVTGDPYEYDIKWVPPRL